MRILLWWSWYTHRVTTPYSTLNRVRLIPYHNERVGGQSSSPTWPSPPTTVCFSGTPRSGVHLRVRVRVSKWLPQLQLQLGSAWWLIDSWWLGLGCTGGQMAIYDITAHPAKISWVGHLTMLPYIYILVGPYRTYLLVDLTRNGCACGKVCSTTCKMELW